MSDAEKPKMTEVHLLFVEFGVDVEMPVEAVESLCSAFARYVSSGDSPQGWSWGKSCAVDLGKLVAVLT